MATRTDTLLTFTADTAEQGSVYAPYNDRRTHGAFQAVLTAGTGTINIEGRVNSAQPWVILASFTATGADLVALLPEMRATLVGGAGATGRVVADRPMTLVA